MKRFLEVTEVSGGNNRVLILRIEHIVRICECGTIYTIDGQKFIIKETYEEIKQIINENI